MDTNQKLKSKSVTHMDSVVYVGLINWKGYKEKAVNKTMR